MPISAKQTELHPADLFAQADEAAAKDRHWWVLYSLSRHEKQLMQRLLGLNVGFYCPIVAKRQRSPAGRVRVSHIPLFSNYVFMLGDEGERRAALTTQCVSRVLIAPDHAQLTADLRQIQQLIATGAPLTPERRIEPGARVRVASGAFRGFEGTVLRREGHTRLLVAVNFLQQGASVLLDDCQLQRLD
ncbi:MAG TPA: transcription termination/antitermination NusG family protein [Pirellulales bacterium]|jgi:transcription antitermination factor NusG|nr:transcription termination/antitermination NusG family protein [Pirellulales bacterium]